MILWQDWKIDRQALSLCECIKMPSPFHSSSTRPEFFRQLHPLRLRWWRWEKLSTRFGEWSRRKFMGLVIVIVLVPWSSSPPTSNIYVLDWLSPTCRTKSAVSMAMYMSTHLSIFFFKSARDEYKSAVTKHCKTSKGEPNLSWQE